MGEVDPKNGKIQAAPSGRLDVNELKKVLSLPEQCVLDSGGGQISAYLWFIAPDALDVRDINELLRVKTGRPSMKYNKENIPGTFYGKTVKTGQSWFCIEIHPIGLDVAQLQDFIDELAQRIIPPVPATVTAQTNTADASNLSQNTWMPAWLQRLLGRN